jgi:hypothetical protein
MTPFTIILIVSLIVLIYILYKYFIADVNTLSSVKNGQSMTTINAIDLATNGTNIPSSNFAYSVWFYVNDWNYRYGEPKVIFGRMGTPSGADDGSIPGVSGIDPCPAVVLGAIENNLIISLGCYPGIDEQPLNPNSKTIIHTCMVSNIPIQKWVNLTISTYGRTLDVYIDGKLVRTCLLPGIASVNNNANVYLTPSGGFNGWTSRLKYFPYPLNPQEAWNIYTSGYSSWLSNLFGSYQVQLSILEDGTPQSSITI